MIGTILTWHGVYPETSDAGPTLTDAAARLSLRPTMAFGCVTIAERHLAKGNEHLNIARKVNIVAGLGEGVIS